MFRSFKPGSQGLVEDGTYIILAKMETYIFYLPLELYRNLIRIQRYYLKTPFILKQN